ncbi:hypothetical protein HYS10_01560, partial [Candidatus Collierbacteria bacterium]|nr:hypothetical protein [Candidatus Collierbacteria bacterium]
SSLNIPAVKLFALVGVKNVLEQGYKMGMDSLAPSAENLSRLGLSMALGGGEVRLLDLTAGYGSFANGGFLVDPVAILKVEDKNGKVIFEYKKVKPERVLDEKVAFLMHSILSDNQARLLTFAPNSYLNLGSRAVAVKTGTTNDLRDNWTLGWTRDVVVGVWVGNNDNSQMKNVASGVSGAAPIWRRIMLEYLSKVQDRPFETPAGVSQVEVDKISGYPAHDGYPSYKEWFIDGSVPTGEDSIHTKINVCRGQADKLANAILVAQGNYDQKEAIVLKEKDPLTVRDLWQKAIDGWVATVAADLRYKIPTEFCDSISGVHVEIISPKDRSRVDSNDVEIRFEVASDKNIDWADLYVDGSFEKRFTSLPYRQPYFLTTGQHRVLVKARNSDGVESDRQVEFGVKEDWESQDITPTASASATVTP